MEKRKVNIKINNCIYNGIANLNKDIIEYNNKEFSIIYDKKINRFIKKDEDKKIIFDFKKQKMTIIFGENNLVFDITLIELYSSDELIKVIYKIGEDEFIFLIEILGGCYEWI